MYIFARYNNSTQFIEEYEIVQSPIFVHSYHANIDIDSNEIPGDFYENFDRYKISVINQNANSNSNEPIMGRILPTAASNDNIKRKLGGTGVIVPEPYKNLSDEITDDMPSGANRNTYANAISNLLWAAERNNKTTIFANL